MASKWNATDLRNVDDAIQVLLDLQGRRWLCRGQSQAYGRLQPSIDRKREHLSRVEMLGRERQSIDLFRSAARDFSSASESAAHRDDFIALMVMRHQDVPTRFLDWSQSPFVAAYFATANDNVDGEIWAFDHDMYVIRGTEQWMNWPETTHGRTGNPNHFDAHLSAFTLAEPPDWFMCTFYPAGFSRQTAQRGLYSFAARFHRDHNDSIADLLQNDAHHHLYRLGAAIKPQLRTFLREKHAVSQATLFPDTAGAAQYAKTVFPETP